jgi:6-pyruvoyl-tetrahydropterin synthase
MSTKSTMFLNDVTVIDLAILDADGIIGGYSVRPRFWVTGNIDPNEGVVVDFSTIKKQIKGLIDHKEFGYDHKLVIGKNAHHYVNAAGAEDWIGIKSNSVEASVPRNAVKLCDNAEDPYDLDAFSLELAAFLEQKFAEEYGMELEFRVTLDVEFEYINNSDIAGSLCYSHGLKSSTSWGCQNIAHGHFSFIQFLPGQNHGPDDIIDYEGALALMREIEEEYGAAVFIFSENVQLVTESAITVGYETERGKFSAKYQKSSNKLIVIDTETTIEFLVAEIGNKYREQILATGYGAVAVSEGLTKGAVLFL